MTPAGPTGGVAAWGRRSSLPLEFYIFCGDFAGSYPLIVSPCPGERELQTNVESPTTESSRDPQACPKQQQTRVSEIGAPSLCHRLLLSFMLEPSSSAELGPLRRSAYFARALRKYCATMQAKWKIA
jgi:hypothetical protein